MSVQWDGSPGEAYIPLDPAKRARSLEILERIREALEDPGGAA